MTRRTLPLLLLLSLGLVMTGCGRLGSSTDATDGGAAAPTLSGAPSSSTDAPEGLPEAVWAAILVDLERRTGGPADPEVVSAEAVTWNDGSLGCPEAGISYTQALVDGFQVVLELDGERYDYRVGSGTSIKLCEGGPLEGGGG